MTTRTRLNVTHAAVLSLLLVSTLVHDEWTACEGSTLNPVAYENLPTTTYSSPNAFPSSLRSKRALVQNTTTEEQAAKSKDTIVSHIALRAFSLVADLGCRVTRAARSAVNRD